LPGSLFLIPWESQRK